MLFYSNFIDFPSLRQVADFGQLSGEIPLRDSLYRPSKREPSEPSI